ncbi:MAG: CARDB domain-containing protein [Patescibacteria group bacterium]
MKNKIIAFAASLFFALFIAVGNVSAVTMDLSIEDVSFSPVQPIVGMTTKIIIKVRYNGDVNLTNNLGVNNVAFSHSNFQQESNSQTGAAVSPAASNPLIPGSSFTYNIFGRFTGGGEKLLIFKIDGANQLSESNETNNTFSKTINVLKDSDLIKLSNHPDIYLIKADGRKHLFTSEPVFWSYYTGTWSKLKKDGANVFSQKISQADFDSIVIGTNMPVKSGSRLIKFRNSPKIYTVFENAKLKLVNDWEGMEFYNNTDWKKKVVTIYDGFETDYIRASQDFTDNDDDGLANSDETNFYHTNPNNHDTDGDGYRDGWEIINGYDPNGSGGL